MVSNSMEASVIDVLGQRSEFLDCLQEAPKDKRSLTDETEVSRSTVDRGIRELEMLDLIEYDDGCYKPTLCGALAAEEYQRYKESIRTICRLQPFLRWMPSDAFDLELHWLTAADLFTPTQGDPQAMVNRHVEIVKTTDHHRCLLPVVGLHGFEAGHETVVHDGGHVELIVDSDSAQTLRTEPHYTELVEEMLATDRAELYVYDGSIPCTYQALAARH